jgi:hypothetical protein
MSKTEVAMKILDPRFKYTPSLHTNIVSTWKRFGFKPTTEAERLARQRQSYGNEQSGVGRDRGASITKLDTSKRQLRIGEK